MDRTRTRATVGPILGKTTLIHGNGSMYFSIRKEDSSKRAQKVCNEISRYSNDSHKDPPADTSGHRSGEMARERCASYPSGPFSWRMLSHDRH
eukprot:352421-Chlamydomonas_euryale.AAC.69